MDINSLLSLRQAWHSFRQNHPKFPDFPDGEALKAGLKLKESDAELINNLI